MVKTSASYSTSIVTLLLIISDYLAVVLAEKVSLEIRNFFLASKSIFYIRPIDFWLLAPVTFIVFMAAWQLYTRRCQFWQILRLAFYAVTTGTLFLVIELFITQQTRSTSRLYMALLYVFVFVFVFVFRFVVKKISAKVQSLQVPVLVIGAGKTAELLVKGIKDTSMGYRVVGFLEDGNSSKLTPILGTFKDAERVIKETGVDRVFIAAPGMEQNALVKLIYDIQPLVKHLGIVPNLVAVPMGSMEIESFYNEKLMLVRIKNNLANRLNVFCKHVFDYSLTIVGTICISPVLALIALWIYKEDPGPIIFKHMRVGKGGKLFPCYKFRSMIVNSQEVLDHILATDAEAKKEWEANFKLKNDPRITKIGKFLRKTSLDELPQIFNVLKGEMSLVGPRPIVQKELDTYYKGYEQEYLSVLPGITGLWQVSGRSDVDYDERIEMDKWYTRNWSVWIDIMILYKTFAVVLLKKGAY